MTKEANLGAQLEAVVLAGDAPGLASIAEAIDRYVSDTAEFPPSLLEECCWF